jgi:hypothetical protein
MQLNVFERLILLNVLPREGGLTTLRIVRDLRDELSFTEAEHEALEMHQEGTEVRWNREADIAREVEIGPKALQVVLESFGDLDKKKSLALEHLAVYERFLEMGESSQVVPLKRAEG